MPANSLSDTIRYVRDPAALEANVRPEEVVLLSALQSKYYGLNESATRIWQLFETPRSVGEICDMLTQEFDLGPADCARDTQELIEDLIVEKLLVVSRQDADRAC